MDEYLKFCARHDLHLVADEIYALSSYDTPYNTDSVDFVSVLALPSLAGPKSLMKPENIHLLYGMSKDFSSNGLRIGCLVTRNVDFRTALTGPGRFPWASSASEQLWHAFLVDKEFKARFLEDNSKALAKGYLQLKEFLDSRGVTYEEGTKYGFFLWVNFGKWCGLEEGESKEDGFRKERELSGRFLDAGVWCATGGTFASEYPGWFRVTFSIEEKVLALGLERLASVLDGVEAGRKVGKVNGDTDAEVDAEDVALKIGGMDLKN